MRRARFLGLVVSLALVAGACGGDDDDPEAGSGTTTSAAPASGDGSTTTTAATGGGDGSTSTVPGGDPDTATTTAADTDDPAAADAPPDLTGQAICELLQASTAEAALGVTGVVATPSTTTTPQCSYRYTAADGSDTDATVAALRTEADLQGRVGDDAFQYVIGINTTVAQGTVTQTPLDIGDQGTLLAGNRLYMAVVQLDGRIVTVLLSQAAGDEAGVTALAQAASVVLAP